MDTDLITRRDAVATAAALRMVMLECSGLSIGAWLSLVEHLVRDQGVGGSNPLAPIFQSSHFSVNCSDRNRSRHSDFSWGGGSFEGTHMLGRSSFHSGSYRFIFR